MDIESGESGEPRRNNRQGAASAYADTDSAERKRYLTYGVIAFIVFMMMKNVLFKDYRQQSKDLLIDSGKDTEEVTRIVPKTRDEMIQEAKFKSELLLSIPNLQKDLINLSDRVSKLEQRNGDEK